MQTNDLLLKNVWSVGHNNYINIAIMVNIKVFVHVVGPCHHGMARSSVGDRGTASDKEGSCE